jgi:hypothetical protein
MFSVKVDTHKTFHGSIPEKLFDIPFGVSDDLNFPYFDVSPDGRFVLNWPVEDRAVKPLSVVYNWHRRRLQ